MATGSLFKGLFDSSTLEDDLKRRHLYIRLYVYALLAMVVCAHFYRMYMSLPIIGDFGWRVYIFRTLPGSVIVIVLSFISWLVHKYRREWTICLVLILNTIFVLVLMYLRGGLRSPFIVSIPAVVFLSAFLLTPRSAYYFAGAGVIGYFLVGLAHIHNLLPVSYDYSKDELFYVGMLIIGTTYAVNAFMAWAFATGLEKRKKAQEQAERQYKILVEKQPDPFLMFDTKGRILHANQSALDMFEYSLDELLYQPWSVLVAPSARFDFGLLEEAFERGESKYFELEGVSVTGRKFMLDVHASPVMDNGKTSYVLAILREITERKKAEIALKASERFLISIFSSIQDGLSILDKSYTIVRVNPTMEKWYAHAMPLVGKKCYEAYHLRTTPCEVCPTRESLATQKSALEIVPKTAEGGKTVGWLELYSFPLRDALTGEMTGVIEYVRDISEQVKFENALKESEEKYRTLAEAAQDFIFIIDKDLRVQYLNSFAAAEFDTTPDKIIGKRVDEIFRGETAQRHIEHLTKVLKSGMAFSTEAYFDFPKGSYWLNTKLTPLKDKDGNVTAVLSISRDFTERKWTEEKLKESEERYRRLVETSPDAIVFTDLNTKILMANKQAADLYGCKDVAELIGKTLYDFIDLEEIGQLRAIRDKLFEDRKVFRREYKVKKKDGSYYICDLSVTQVTAYNGEIYGYLGVFRDITEQKRQEAYLRENELRYRNLVEMSPDAITLFESNGTILMLNRRAVILYGLEKAEEAIGKSVFDYVAEEDIEETKNALAQVLTTREIHTGEYKLKRKDGSIFIGEIFGGPLVDSQGNIEAVLVVSRDITQRKIEDNALRESEERFRELADAAFEAIVIHDKGIILDVNRSAVEMFKLDRDAFNGKSIFEFIHADDIERVREYVQTGFEGPYEARAVRSDGSTFPASAVARSLPYRGKIVRVVAIRDITSEKYAQEERKRLQDQLILSDRLASLGQLVLGIAHEFNNIMAGLRGYAQISQLPGKEHRLKELPVVVTEMVDRAQGITESLLGFSERFQPKIEDVYPAEIIESILKLMKKELERENITVEMAIPKNYKINTDGGKLQQVLLNLIINARHAMPNGGILSFSVEEKDATVVIKVKDTGVGIPKENLSRIFDPFFTTKGPIGGSNIPGTGLGLSLSYGIMQSLGGSIEVESKVKEGSTFSLLLPL